MIRQSSQAMALLTLPFPFNILTQDNSMTDKNFDVIIIGGSYAGLSAAMALGRALRNVLIIDSGLPCNRQTPHSHNFITYDGEKPAVISRKAREQVLQYETVQFLQELVVTGQKTEHGFEINTDSGRVFHAKKLVFATGITDIMPVIPGFAECWGISVIHCPYCHGYEYRHEETGILANGDMAFEFCKLISQWTRKLTVFTHGISTLTPKQVEHLANHEIRIVETEIDRLVHHDGKMEEIIFKNGFVAPLTALYARIPFIQHSDIPVQLACELTEQGYIKVDVLQRTTVPGVFACGDNTSPMRSVANAVATGNMAGAAVNKELIEEEF